MSFSQEWDQRYAENTHNSIWPWSDLVSLVYRHCKQRNARSRVLELGCGAGANIAFFQALGVQYHAIEGSPTVVARLHAQFPELAERIVAGDFTQQLPFGGGFELIVDRASLTHNSTAAIVRTLGLVRQSLQPGGLFIGVDWFSCAHSDFAEGQPAEDGYTRTAFSSGQFEGVGRVHFSDEAHLRELFAGFELIFLEHKLLQRVEPASAGTFASWHIVARKPA